MAKGAARAAAELGELRVALARESRIASALREVGAALGATLDLDDLLELILGRLADLVDAERTTLYLVDEASGDLVSQLVVGDEVRAIRLKLGHGIAGSVAKTGKPLRVPDAYDDPRFEHEWDLLTGFRTKSILAAPLKNHLGRTIGVIQVLNKRGGEGFTFEDESILVALSTQAAVAIDNSRLFLSLTRKNRQLLDTKEQLEDRVKDLELLFELERATARARAVEDVVLAALRAACRATEARGAVALLLGDGEAERTCYSLDADSPGDLHRETGPVAEDVLERALREGRRLRLPGDDGVVSAAGDEHAPLGFPILSALVVPLDGEEGPLGALAVLTRRDGRGFTDQDGSLLDLVGANASTAVRLFRASAARERSERLGAIGRLLSQVIHDFKTPLTVISGYVQLLATAEEPARREELSRAALRQFDVIGAMQREVLEFARGERTTFVRKVYLNHFVDELRQELAHEIAARPVELSVSADTKVVARFDAARVARALHNLTRNAIEAMGEAGGRLSIDARLDGSDLVFTVADTGPGIPPEIQGRLFQSFVTARKEGGTGLGLAIVKKIAEEHGGVVRVMSSPVGARFELRLPQEAPVVAAAAARRASLPPARGADAGPADSAAGARASVAPRAPVPAGSRRSDPAGDPQPGSARAKGGGRARAGGRRTPGRRA